MQDPIEFDQENHTQRLAQHPIEREPRVRNELEMLESTMGKKNTKESANPTKNSMDDIVMERAAHASESNVRFIDKKFQLSRSQLIQFHSTKNKKNDKVSNN